MAEENKVDLLMSVDLDAAQALKDLAEMRLATENLRKEQKNLDKSTAEGRVEYEVSVSSKILQNSSYGNFVEVEHGEFRTMYAHLQNVLVSAKQSIEAGQPIAISGNTGRSIGEHVHFEIRYQNKFIDPKPVLDYIYDLIDWTKTELSAQIEQELRRNK